MILNEIIERNYLNNENKNKNIIIPMFMMIIKEKIMKQIKHLNTDIYKNDKLLKYYLNFKNILMNPVMFQKILMKLNSV